MGKTNIRLDAARKAYRAALDAARTNPTPEAWATLLTAGKELSAAQEPKSRGRRTRRTATPSYSDLEGPAAPAQGAPEPEIDQLD